MKGDHIGEFEELVLLAVQGLPDQAYGVSVQQLLERETSRRVSIGAVYAALDRLEAKGLVRSRIAPGTAVRGGRSRRAFIPTAAGARALAEMRRVRDRLWRAAGSTPARERT
ncbi:MAG TPA: PadR family transcriptional regulator [Vicinamibacterales bacterium]|nr:PadR family transcriptional regulator [Vicinamibacterales bacterium]